MRALARGKSEHHSDMWYKYCVSRGRLSCATITNNPKISVAENNKGVFHARYMYITGQQSSAHCGPSGTLDDGVAAILNTAICHAERERVLKGVTPVTKCLVWKLHMSHPEKESYDPPQPQRKAN